MSAFKQRPNKLKHLSTVQTLDEIHKDFMYGFDQQKKLIPIREQRLEDAKKELKILEIDIKNGKNKGIDAIKQRAELKSEINDLIDEIQKLKNGNDISEYFSKAGDIIVDYYNNTSGTFYNCENLDSNKHIILDEDDDDDDPSESDSDICKTITESDVSDRLIQLNLMSQTNRKVKKPVKKRKISHDQHNSKSILNFLEPDADDMNTDNVVETHNYANRASLQDKYLMLVDKEYACDHVKTNHIKTCSRCGIEKILMQSEGSFVCMKCGEVDYIIIESEVPSHKDAINEKPKYPYKKLNHLKEKLNQLQSKETAEIAEEVFDLIEKELKKRRIPSKKSTPPLIKTILKKHKLVDCYEHLQQIYCKISKSPPVYLSRESEEKVIQMFNDMQDSYQKHRPANRSNFLNYSYVLNKIFTILGMTYHAKFFGLLKSKDKLREQDVIWGKICKDMGWKYYSSF